MLAPAHHGHPHRSERHEHVHGAADPAHRLRHHRGGLALVPRRGHPAPDAVLGADGGGRPQPHRERLVARSRAGGRHRAGGARLQPVRRLAPRLAGPAAATGLTAAVALAPVVLEVKDLHAYLYTRWGVVRAVDGVSFALREGETLGLVGESGCGKTMTGLSVLRLLPEPAGRIVRGQVLLEGEDLVMKSESEMREVRGRRISMILQDPQTSLNPVFTVGAQLVEALKLHHREPAHALWRRAEDALRRVKVAAPEQRMRAYPHQMSGGMKQRVVGAIAVAGEPRVLIADEPTTALDVTIQLQYLALLKEIQART